MASVDVTMIVIKLWSCLRQSRHAIFTKNKLNVLIIIPDTWQLVCAFQIFMIGIP